MAKPYSQDLRERMVRAVLAGQSRREVKRMFDVSASCMIKLMQRVDATSNCRPRIFGRHNSPVKKSRFDQATSDAAAMISAAPSASNTARIMTVIASAV